MNWLAFIAVLFGIASLAYAFRSRTVEQHPAQRGLFVGTGLALLASGAWVMLQPVTPKLTYDNLLLALLVLLSVLMLGLLLGYPFTKKAAGPLLYGIPRPMSRKVSGTATALLFLILVGFRMAQDDSSIVKDAELIFYILVVAYFASPLFGKVELRQEGILETSTLYRWKTILAYRWTGQDQNFLILSIKSFWRKTAAIDLPLDHKSAVDAILKQQIHQSEPTV